MDNPTQDPKYSWVYQELTKNDNGGYNLVNSVAYIIYKQRKIDFYKSHDGNPTEEQVKNFHEIFLMEASIEGLRTEASIIVTQILQNTLANKVIEIETRLEQEDSAAMKRELEALKNVISQSQNTLNGDLNTKHTAVMSELGKINEKGLGAWLKEIGKAVLITVASTIVLWLLFIAFVKGQASQDSFTKKYLPTDTAPAASTPK
ncbi:hypothetical protein ACT4YP_20555 (plasmid) [Acinetobacter baumannii]